MKYAPIFLILSLLLFPANALAQKMGTIIGNVRDGNTKETLFGATLVVEGNDATANTDEEGNFKLSLPVGTYNISAYFVGFQPQQKFNVVLTTGNAQIVNFELSQTPSSLEEVVINYDRGQSAVAADMTTPLSVQQLTSEEIKSSPGGNFDVSKVVQTLPGVGVSNGSGARNDIIIRGGAPNENVYYLDGIEIPVFNHFQTQGSSGGAQGLLNVSFIESLKLSSSAFDAKYDNALASTLVIKQRDGNPERFSGNLRVSATESALTLEGPLSEKTTFLASARKSYLELLFQLIDLPIRPNFYDFQYKVSHKFNDRFSLTAIGLGGIDNFRFAPTEDASPETNYVLRSSPYINQWTYTIGFNLKQQINDGYINYVLSRNRFQNSIDKFEDQNQLESQRTSAINSGEIETKFWWDINKYVNNWKLSGGVSIQNVGYEGEVYRKTGPEAEMSFNSEINFWKYGAFVQASRNIFNDRLLVSGGMRSDVNSFTDSGNDPLKTLSPRLSLAYQLSPKVDLTASVGTYFKIPTYTALGYQNADDEFVNRQMEYIQSTHYVLGTQFLPKSSLRFTMEGFYKKYHHYPVSTNTGVSLANLGNDYGSIGSENLLSTGSGETYGFEVYAQQKLVNRLFYVASYSYIRSKFSGLDGELLPSSWDTSHLLSASLGYKFPKQWDLGLKYRYAGGAPYTPFDRQRSRENYVVKGVGELDYNQLNSERLAAYSQLDLRLDKRLNFRKTSLVLYLDLQNILLTENQDKPKYTFARNADNTGFATTDGEALRADGSNAIPQILDTSSANIVPSIGFIFEF